MIINWPLFIPSYHRPDNLKTVKTMKKIGWAPSSIYVFIDDEADDKADYEQSCSRLGVNLVVFDMSEARKRYDYVHRPSVSRRSAGQARNMFQDFAEKNGIVNYIVQDDDSTGLQIRPFGKYERKADAAVVSDVCDAVFDFMKRKHLGLFGLSQTGDMFEKYITGILRNKVMNFCFYDTRYLYRGERGVQDNDTSMFTSVLNCGLFTGSLRSGLVLAQTASAVQKGGLTDLYNECKLLNKSLITVIQYPSAIHAEKQKRNGGRLHHRIEYRFLKPMLIKVDKGNNIAWDTYEEDIPFTNECIVERI